MRIQWLSTMVLVLAPGFTGCTTSLRPSPVRPEASPAAPLPKPTRGITESLPGGQATNAGQAHSSRKRVAGKEEPVTLIADDHSSCTVDANKFKDVKIGDTVSCDWGTGVVRRP